MEPVKITEIVSNNKFMIKPLWLTYPIWGTILSVGLTCLASKYKLHDIANGAFILSFFGLLPSAVILLSDIKQDFLVRVILLILYAVGSAFVIFTLGGMARCWFCIQCY